MRSLHIRAYFMDCKCKLRKTSEFEVLFLKTPNFVINSLHRDEFMPIIASIFIKMYDVIAIRPEFE